jgi:tetratricopeptide (TPR) repeat protein
VEPAVSVEPAVPPVAESITSEPVSLQPAIETSEFSLAGAVPDDPPFMAAPVKATAVWDVPVSDPLPGSAASASEPVAAEVSSAWNRNASVDEPPSPGAWLASPIEDVPQDIEPVSVEPMAIPPSMAEAAPTESLAPEPDYEAHYTLGIAYKNMGLYEDAMEEFHLSKSADSFYLDSCLMTALCLKDQRDYESAILGLEAVLSDPRCQGAKGQAIRYELGMLYEAESQWEQAVSTYQLIDVPQRLESLRGKAQVTRKEFRLAS